MRPCTVQLHVSRSRDESIRDDRFDLELVDMERASTSERAGVGTSFSLSRPRSGNVPSPLATNGDASSGVFAISFFLARGNVAVAPALAGPRGTTAARSGERGPNTPDKRWSGNRGGGIKLDSRAKNCIGVITRCVAPLRLGLRSRYATRPSGSFDRRSKPHSGRAQ